MTSRRPMTRSFSGNGRSGSFNNEEEVSSSNGRTESRNPYLSNVRPENSYSSHRYSGSHYRPPRSTLCSVMAQLSEDIQPSFETTLKSKAVSESCNVKFSCVVSGFPAPEMKWYKDDMELDRYCGLPKYEIGRNGKTHTLHIYNCTVDDAAIYQVSACNSKGIVSCSGVLEVGVMNEFKIHQRFFAKLKQKAENKRRELEENRRRGQENVQTSPQRKRTSPAEVELPASPQGVAREAEVVEQPAAAAVEPNGVSADAGETALVAPTENGHQTPEDDVGKVIITTKPPTAEISAKKKIRVSNGLEENSYDGGIALAQFLAEARHSQASEDRPSSARLEKTVGMDTSPADRQSSGRLEKTVGMDTSPADRQSSAQLEKTGTDTSPADRQSSARLEKTVGMDTSPADRQSSARLEKTVGMDTSPADRQSSARLEKTVGMDTSPADRQSSARLEKTAGIDISTADANKEKERDMEREMREKERALEDERERKIMKEKERERERKSARERELLERTTHSNNASRVKTEAHKESEHHKIQASISSVLHSVKDFFFGKGKKGHAHDSSSEDSSEESGRDYPVAPALPCPNPPPPHPQELYGRAEVYKPLREEAVPLEVDGPQEPSVTVVSDTAPVSLEQLTPDEHKHRVSVLRTEERPPSPERPPEDVADSVKQEDAEMCVEVVNDRPKTPPAPGLAAFSEVPIDIHSQRDPVIQVVIPPAHGVNIPVLSLETHHQVERDETEAAPSHGPWASSRSPGAPGEACLHTTNPTSMYDSGSPPYSTVSLTDSRCLTETIDSEKEEEIHVDMSVERETEEIAQRNNTSEETEQDGEVTREIQSCPYVCESVEMINLGKPALEERVETFDSIGENAKIEAQERCIIVPQENGESDYSKTEVESIPVLLERVEETLVESCEESIEDVDCFYVRESVEMINSEKPALEERVDTLDSTVSTPVPLIFDEKIGAQEECIIVPQESGESDYSKTEVESIPALLERVEERHCEESIDVDSGIKEISPSALEGSDEDGALKAALENNSVSNLKIPEQVLHMVDKSAEGMNEKSESSQKNEAPTFKNESEIEVEKIETQTKVDVLDGSSSHSETPPEKDVRVPEELLGAPESRPDVDTSYLGAFIQNVPEKNIFDSALEELPEMKLTVPEAKQNEPMMIPTIEIMEPEDKVPTLPLTLVMLSDSESEQAFFPNHDATGASDITITVNSAAVSPAIVGVTPVQDSTQDDNLLPPTEKVQKVAQQDEKPVILNGEKPSKINGESLSGMDQLIPTINVSCTDDFNLGDDELSLAKPLFLDMPKPEEARKVPLFVVPPISVSLNETKQPLRTEPTESESFTPSLIKTTESVSIAEADRANPPKETKVEPDIEWLGFKNHTPPMMSPASLRRFMAKSAPSADAPGVMAVPAITLGDCSQSDKTGDELSGGSTPTSSLSCESSPRLRRRDSLTPIRSATPEELASGARRKIFIPKTQGTEGEIVAVGLGALDSQGKKETPYMSPSQARRAAFLQAPAGSQTPPMEKETPYMSPSQARRAAFLQAPTGSQTPPMEKETPYMSPSQARRSAFLQAPTGSQSPPMEKETPYMSPSQARRAAFLQAPAGSQTPPMEKRSPLLARRKATLDVPRVLEETPSEETDSTDKETQPAEKEKLNPFKAPQVIRKIRGEPFTDASGHLKLWCQFFNVLSDSTIKWYRDDEEIAEVQRSGGDESQVALAIIQASSPDCGVYGCTIKNEYGTDSTDFLLSVDILSEFLLREDLEVGEEIEMTPLLFSRGLADTGVWGDKFFGRIMTAEGHVGEGCAHKASRVKVIYGLDPVFESGSTCIIKVQNPIAYGTKEDSNLTERNLEITKKECKIQNMVREYCKIFAAEARVVENFGSALEVIPQYLMYRPANSVPYATVEVDLQGVFLKYCLTDAKGRLITRTISEVEQKCCTFQHWIHQWTHGNLLVTQLEGVGMKVTHVKVATKSKGYQGLTDSGSPKVFEQFLTQHQCNYYCGLLGLRSLKTMDSLQQPPKVKASRSPLLNRKLGPGSSSPQLQKKLNSPQTARKVTSSPQTARKVTSSPQTARKAFSSPKVARKTEEPEDDKSKTVEIPKVVTMT